jgi:hypothetical protein
MTVVCWVSCWLMVGWAAAAGVDFAESRHARLWLQNPVLGGPSFDSFVHSPQNPLHRGAPPYEWPVNSFYFADPASGNWYIYVGDYPEGYASRRSRCVLLRSSDHGHSWTNLGVVLEGSKATFDRGGSTPDVSVVHADGRYHMVYDWGELDQPDWTVQGGLAYAWADKPEGPWHRVSQPITQNKDLPLLLGKYRRTYAATLVRRQRDWMILGMMDRAPNCWALFGITAPRPEGPYGERVLLRNVEADGFHPPLLEFYPAFVHGGFVYAPATSVALNRNHNALFRAPLERAAEAGAWELAQNGSVWHADPVEHEAYGIWGQTFSGWVDKDGMLQVSFHSRDRKGMGTVNIAARPWKQPMRRSGFVLSGHQGPSLTLLRRAFAGFRLDATLRLSGTARVLMDYAGALGPNAPQSDATLHPLCLSRCDAVELTDREWRVVRFGDKGERAVIASGARSSEGAALGLERKPDGATSLFLDGQAVWSGAIAPRRAQAGFVTGIEVEPHTHLTVERYCIAGKARPAAISYLFSEALLGAGQRREDWQESQGTQGRYGVVAVARQPGARVKWNVEGTRFTLWSPRGPDFGTAQVKVDGRAAGVVDMHAAQPTASAPVWRSPRFKDGPHAVILTATEGRLVVDSLTAEASPGLGSSFVSAILGALCVSALNSGRAAGPGRFGRFIHHDGQDTNQK